VVLSHSDARWDGKKVARAGDRHAPTLISKTTFSPTPISRRALNVHDMVDERLLLIEAQRVVGGYWSIEVKPVPGGGYEYKAVSHGELDPRSVTNELLNDGYEAEGLITLMTLRSWELDSEGEAELANGLRELGVRPLTLREATLVIAREEARRAFAGDLSPWNLLSRLDHLCGQTDGVAPELEQFARLYPKDPDQWGDRRERGERMILDMAQPLLAYSPG
jgi:hypothetical protein